MVRRLPLHMILLNIASWAVIVGAIWVFAMGSR